MLGPFLVHKPSALSPPPHPAPFRPLRRACPALFCACARDALCLAVRRCARCTGQGTQRPEPPTSGHRWPSCALASHHTKPDMVRCEDDLLYLRSLPTFDHTLRASDSELLLSYLTAPLLRQPLLLSFFCTRCESLGEWV